MERLLALAVVLVLTAAFSAWWKARDGRVRANLPEGADEARHPWDGLPIEAADLAGAVGDATPLTLVEFTAPDCQPCVATKAKLDAAVIDRREIGVAVLDVGEALELARAHRIMRAPTTLLITQQGHLLGRVSGVPRDDELTTLLDSARDPATSAPA